MLNELERLTGSLADRYRIQREPGRGGMATVYLAEDVKLHPGTPPFTGPTPQIVLAKHLRARAPDLRDLCPSLGARTAAVISQGLAKAPEHRFPSAGEFAQALDSSL